MGKKDVFLKLGGPACCINRQHVINVDKSGDKYRAGKENMNV